MDIGQFGTVIKGSADLLRRSAEAWERQPVDMDSPASTEGFPAAQTTIGKTVSVTGPGTFFGRAQRTLTLSPAPAGSGWAFLRDDLRDVLPIRVSVDTVWTTVRNIVLCSGSPHNYMRMVEHIVALKTGMGVDNLTIRVDSGDPPLFDRGSMDLVEAIEKAGIVDQKTPAPCVTVREPVTAVGQNGGFLTFLPAEPGSRDLTVDCAVDFKSSIGRQRIRFPVNRETFRHGALARTNAPLWQVLYTRTLGLVFADTRNLGYNTRNILIHSRFGYINNPQMFHNGKSLEAVWHRATLDLLAAAALIDRGRLCGRIISFKAGHALDVDAVRALYQRDLLVTV
jgi:UDP-3-O-[3-hydroxymyristoyl] N-acetylglucosamine deacetylase